MNEKDEKERELEDGELKEVAMVIAGMRSDVNKQYGGKVDKQSMATAVKLNSILKKRRGSP